MNNEITTNLIMQPIQYDGQVYFSSQYFHSQYRNNSGSKYEKLSDFNRLIRSIEAYPTYVERRDIIELTWSDVKKSDNSVVVNIALLFKSNSYKPIMLINATAQIMLTHHLDDELSKGVSVAVNAKAAEATKPSSPAQLSGAFKAMLSMAKAAGLTGNQAILGADKATKTLTGESPVALLGIELVSESKDLLLTPTELGQPLNKSASKINQMLESLGLQTSFRDKDNKLHWELTDKGKAYAELLDVGKAHSNGTPIQQIKWRSSVRNFYNYLESLNDLSCFI